MLIKGVTGGKGRGKGNKRADMCDWKSRNPRWVFGNSLIDITEEEWNTIFKKEENAEDEVTV